MTQHGHVISTGADGRLAGMTTDEANTLLDLALQHDRVVVHFHGGLVKEAQGVAIAESLTPVYDAAGAYPLFIVWRSGALEIVRNNLLEIAREQFFEQLVRKVLRWSIGKIRGDGEGGRAAGGFAPPSEKELLSQLAGRKRLTDPEAGTEPFVNEIVHADGPAPGARSGQATAEEGAEPLTLSVEEAELFIAEIANDPVLEQQVAGMIAHRDLEWFGRDGGRAPVVTAEPVPSLIDDEVLTQIAAGEDDTGGKGLVSMTVLGRKALQVLRAVLKRYRTQTDGGAYPTVVEEVLRAFYLGAVGGSVWQLMKKETADTFEAAHADRGGALLLDRLAAANARGATPKVTLVGHSTGAVFIDNLLISVARANQSGARPWPASATFQVCFLAPACTTQHFALALDAAEHLIGRFRMFTMTDDAERADRLVGAVYPRSLLYLVSGLLERDRDASAVAPVLGLSRYLAAHGLGRLLASELGVTARLDSIRKYSSDSGRVILSPSAADAVEGARSAALKHGAFDDDDLVRDSLAYLIRTW